MKVRLKVLRALGVLCVLITLPTSVAFAASRGDMPQQEDEDDGEDVNSAICNGDVQHPILSGIAETYDVDYDTVLGYFCDGYGAGEIMLAFETSDVTGDLPADLLDSKGQGNGWGQVWQELGLIGNESDGGPPPWAGRGKPDWAGQHQASDPNSNPGRGNGSENNPGRGNGNQNNPGQGNNSENNPGQGNGNQNNPGQGNNSENNPGRGNQLIPGNSGNRGNGNNLDDDEDYTS
jgi:hypothetical protein